MLPSHSQGKKGGPCETGVKRKPEQTEWVLLDMSDAS